MPQIWVVSPQCMSVVCEAWTPAGLTTHKANINGTFGDKLGMITPVLMSQNGVRLLAQLATPWKGLQQGHPVCTMICLQWGGVRASAGELLCGSRASRGNSTCEGFSCGLLSQPSAGAQGETSRACFSSARVSVQGPFMHRDSTALNEGDHVPRAQKNAGLCIQGYLFPRKIRQQSLVICNLTVSRRQVFSV